MTEYAVVLLRLWQRVNNGNAQVVTKSKQQSCSDCDKVNNSHAQVVTKSKQVMLRLWQRENNSNAQIVTKTNECLSSGWAALGLGRDTHSEQIKASQDPRWYRYSVVLSLCLALAVECEMPLMILLTIVSSRLSTVYPPKPAGQPETERHYKLHIIKKLYFLF